MYFVIVAAVCMFAVLTVYSSDIQGDLKNNILRMHIIANSNLEKDQDIKIKVRDEIIKSKNADCVTAQKTANSVLLRENVGYSAKAKYETCFVPKKEYKNIAMPEGEYHCLNVVLGSGKGENWWCIAYPPLCFTEAVIGEISEEAKRELKGKLTKDALETIIKSGDVTFKFKTVEEFQKILQYLKK